MYTSPGENDYIDIHTHSLDEEEGTFRILNVYPETFDPLNKLKPVSIGLHPWFIKNHSGETLEKVLEQIAPLPQVKAIGETGLDKLTKVPFQIQEEIFLSHIRIAYEFRKPLIIHCVRAYSEVLGLKKKYSSEISWIIHGFNGSIGIAMELVKAGFYLSLGNRLLKNEEKSLDVARNISIERIFLETDEENVSVKNLYGRLAGLYHSEILSIRNTIRENYFKAFKF